MYKMDGYTLDKKPSKAKTIWLILVIITLFASNTVWALLHYQQQSELGTKSNNLNDQNESLVAKNKALESKNNELTKNNNEQWREIPELGVKYKISDTTKPLTYAYKKSGKDIYSVEFSSIDIINSIKMNSGYDWDAWDDDSCYGETSVAGTMSRLGSEYLNSREIDLERKTIQEMLDEGQENWKKVGSYYFWYQMPNGSSACELSLVKKARNAVADMFSTLTSIE